MTSMVSAIMARGTVTTASWISCSSRYRAASTDPACSTDTAGMAGAPCFQQVQRLGAAHLTNRDTVGPQAQGGPHQFGQGYDTIPCTHGDQIGGCALQFPRIFDQHDAITGFRDLGQQRIDQRGLAGRCPAGDQDVFPFQTARRRNTACPTVMIPAAT